MVIVVVVMVVMVVMLVVMVVVVVVMKCSLTIKMVSEHFWERTLIH